MNKRTEQKENRRRQILSIALDLFVEKGFLATKVSDIAEKAGISKGLMFNYFPSKENLYETLVLLGVQKSQTLFAMTDYKPLEFFYNAAKLILNSAKQSSTVAKMFVLMNEAARSTNLSAELKNIIQNDNIEKSAEIISEGQKRGTIKEGNPKALATTFWAAIMGVCQIAIQNNNFIYPEPEWIVDIIKKNGEHYESRS